MVSDSNSHQNNIALYIATSALILGSAWAFASSSSQKATTEKMTQDSPPVEYKLWNDETVKISIPKEVFPTEQERNEMEAKIPNCQHGWMKSNQEGEQLHYRYILPKSQKPKAVIVYMHGIQSHSGKAWITKDGTKLNFSLLVQYFVEEKGFALYAMDLLGHGYSSGTRMYVPDWKINRDDLADFCKFASRQHSDVPFFLTGESYGSNLCLHVAQTQFQTEDSNDNNKDDDDDLKKRFGGICVTAPAIVGDLPPPPILYFLRDVLAPRYPKWTPFFMPNPVSPDRVWKDPEVLALNTDERKCEMGLDASGMPFRLGTAVQLLQALEVARETTIPKLAVPFCVVHGTADYGVPIVGTDFLEQNAATSKEDQFILRLEGAYHDLLGSLEFSKQTVEYMGDFIERRMKQLQEKK